MYTLGAGRILIKSNIIECLLNLMAWKASWAHRTGENEKKNNDKIKKSVQTSSACGDTCSHEIHHSWCIGILKRNYNSHHMYVYTSSQIYFMAARWGSILTQVAVLCP